MGKGKAKRRQSLGEILASVSDTLFPEQLGAAPVSVNSRDVDGDTPLHVLVRRGDRYGVRLLLENGADPNAVGDMGETPLHVAVSGGDVEIVGRLLEFGADASVRCEFGDTPTERSAQSHSAVSSAMALANKQAGRADK